MKGTVIRVRLELKDEPARGRRPYARTTRVMRDKKKYDRRRDKKAYEARA